MQAIPKCKATIAATFIARLLAALPAFWMAAACGAAPGGDQAKSPKVFATAGTLALTLTAPWREFMHNKSEKKRYPGTLEYVDESGAKRSIPVAFEPRGKNRLKVCKLPPIKLIFDKQAIEGTPFRGNKSLKLSTHCDSGERWEHYVLKEMLALPHLQPGYGAQLQTAPVVGHLCRQRGRLARWAASWLSGRG
jgi:hypothetical protein